MAQATKYLISVRPETASSGIPANAGVVVHGCARRKCPWGAPLTELRMESSKVLISLDPGIRRDDVVSGKHVFLDRR